MSNTSEIQWIKKLRKLVWEMIMSPKLYLWLRGYRTVFSNHVESTWYGKTNLYENIRTQFATVRENSLNLSKKDAATGRGVGSWQNPAKQLNKSSCLKGVHKKNGLHPVRSRVSEGQAITQNRAAQIWTGLNVSKKLSCQDYLFIAAKSSLLWLLKLLLSSFFRHKSPAQF